MLVRVGCPFALIILIFHCYTMFKILRKSSRPYRWLHRMFRRGDWLPDEIPFAKLYFSQFGEDLFLDSLFSDKPEGFWIDVGAFHPVMFSNTWMLYRRGWRGINIEPNPSGFQLFEEMRVRDINLNVAVGMSPSDSREFWCNGPYSSFSYANAEAGGASSSMTVRVDTLAAIVERYVGLGKAVDLLSVDCEGHDLGVLQSADWNTFRPSCVIVEDLSEDEGSEISQFLKKAGYQRVLRMGLSSFFIAEGSGLRM
jgi:FkbM family methyltransferase